MAWKAIKETRFLTITKVHDIIAASERIISEAGNPLSCEKLRELVFLSKCEKYSLWQLA